MRRWIPTAILATTAVAAALIAPRLMAAAPVEPAPVGCKNADAVAVVDSPDSIPRRVVELVQAIAQGALPASIPEIDVPSPVEPAQPDPDLEDFWIEMVDCGMG